MKKCIGLLWLLLAVPGYSAELAQSTAREVSIYFEDPATGLGKTSLTVTSITCRYLKNDMTSASFSPTVSGGGANDMSEIGGAGNGHGYYKLELTAAQLDTIGNFDLHCQISGSNSPATLYQVVAATSPTITGSYASIDDVWEYAKTSVTDASGMGYWLKTNADVPTSQYSPVTNRTTIATLASQTSFTLTAGSVDDNAYNGWLIYIQDGTTAEQYAAGVVEDYTGSTKTVTLRTDPAIFTMATGDIVYLQPDRSLKSTVDNRSLDVTATGGAGVDWANVEAPTTTVGLSGTTISTSQVVASVSGAVGSVTGLTAADVGAIKTKTDYLPSATAGAAGGVFIAGTNAATTVTTAFTSTFTGNLTGSVASVTGNVGGNVTGSVGSVVGNVGGNLTGSVGTMTAAALAQFFTLNSGTTYASAVAGSVVKEIVTNAGGSALTEAGIADAVWDEATAGHVAAGSTGKALTDAASAGDPWNTALPGAYVAGKAGYIIGNTLDALMSSRAAATSLTTAQTDLDDIQTRIPAALVSGRMDSSTGAMAANVLTAASIASDAFTAAKFAADVATEVATTLMATTYEGTTTFKNFLQYGSSALFGKYNSASGTFNFRDIADSKNRIIYTTSSTARTSVTLSPD